MQWKEWRIFRFLKLLHRAFDGYKKSIVALIFLGFLSGFFEGVGINAVVPLFSVLMRGADTDSPDAITKAIHDFFSYLGVPFQLKYLLMFIVLLFVLRALMLLLSNVIKVFICSAYEMQTRERLFKSFLSARWSFLLQQKMGHLETVLLTNIRYSSLVLEHTCMLIIVVTNLLVYLAVAFNISAFITALILALGLLLFAVLRPSFGGTKKFSQQAEKINRSIAHFVNENILGMKTIKAMAAADPIVGIGKKYFEDLRKFTVKISLLRSSADVIMQPVGVIFICVLFAISYKAPGFKIGAFAAVIYLIQRIFIYFQQVQASVRTINESAPYMLAFMNLADQVREQKEDDGAGESFAFRKSLAFRDVFFSYDGIQQTLSGLNFEIRRGETIGLIGSSGAGKTTVVDLILRLFQPEKGLILLDGKDVRRIGLTEWRKQIGYVSQDLFLMNSTIAENIRFHDASLTDQQIAEAAKQANIYEFIQGLPRAFNTVIGERGIALSGGQRQRIAIARVLARKPKILILDEATSALDNESELQIQKVIEGLKGKITVFIIAHRLTTVLNTDRIIALDKGCVAESGAPQALLADPHSYFSRVFRAVQS